MCRKGQHENFTDKRETRRVVALVQDEQQWPNPSDLSRDAEVTQLYMPWPMGLAHADWAGTFEYTEKQAHWVMEMTGHRVLFLFLV